MTDVESTVSDFEAARSCWHRAQAALNPHFVASEPPPDEKLYELEHAIEQL